MNATIQKTYYRNREHRESVTLRNGRGHGVVRVWHKNSKRASEEPFESRQARSN